MDKNVGLSAPEAYLLVSLPRYDVRKAVKLGFIGLLAQGMLRSEDETRSGFFRARHIIHLRAAPNLRDDLPPVAAALVRVVRAAAPRDGVMKEIVSQSQWAFGNSLRRFTRDCVGPALVARGLVEMRRVKLLGLIPTHRYERTPAGEVEKIRLENAMSEARAIPQYLDSDLAQAVALVATVGVAIFLVDELQPHYQGIAQAMRDRGGDGSSTDGGGDWGGADSGGFDPGSFSFDGIDFSSFDFGDFDAGFDGGGDGGDGGGDGGGSGC